MVKEIRVYIEGGGDSSNTKAQMRQGFSGFLRDLVQMARSQNIKWQITGLFHSSLATHTPRNLFLG